MESFTTLRGQDEFAGGFVRNAITRSLAERVNEVGFSHLAEELAQGELIVDHISREDGGPDWESFVHEQTMESGTGNCLDVSWFFLEYYIYRRILGQLGYFLQDSENFQKDPWIAYKTTALEAALGAFKPLDFSEEVSNYTNLVLWSVWSQASNLTAESIKSMVENQSQAQANILANDIQFADSLLLDPDRRQQTVIIILNGCGAELLCDLWLAAALVLKDGRLIELHVSPYPCGPTSVTRPDVQIHIDRLYDEGIELGKMLREYVSGGQIAIVSDDFYAGPLEFAQAPQSLKDRFDPAAVIFVKGDRNYRRLIGSRGLPLDFPFTDAISRITYTPLVAVRICDTPLLCGLTERERSRVEMIFEQEWYSNQQYAVVQYSYRSTVDVLPVPEEVQQDQQPVTDSQQSFDAYSQEFPGGEPVTAAGEGGSDEQVIPAERSSSLDAAARNAVNMDGYDDELRAAQDDILLMQGEFADLASTGSSPRADALATVSGASNLTGDNASAGAAAEPSRTTTGIKRENSSVTAESSGAKQQKLAGDDLPNDDALNDADDVLWADPSRSSAGLDVYLEDIGTKDANRPFINVKLPPRAYSSFEYFSRTRPGEDELSLAELWASMTKPQKQKYDAQALEDKLRYEHELIERARQVAKIIDRAVRNPSTSGSGGQ